MQSQKGTEILEKDETQIHVPSEKGQTQKTTYGMTPFIVNVCKSKSIELESRLKVSSGWGWEWD